jgi:hypothetical protein
MRSAVLLVIFKRPWCVRQVMGALREAAPPRLYIAADGPRLDQPEEAALCEMAREEALNVSWPCEVKTLFRERNMGGPLGIPDALNWFFSHEPEGIILEDDTVPVREFFSFCDCLLEYYRETPRVMHITGNNFHVGLRYGKASYFFSATPHTWGWATWRRAWQCYDEYVSLPGLDSFLENQLPRLVDASAIPNWRTLLTGYRSSPPGSWDPKWQYVIWQRGGLCATPQVNMVRNIGFGDDAAHFRSPFIWMYLKTRGLGRVTHPEVVGRNPEADWVDSRVCWGDFPCNVDASLREAFLRLKTGEFAGFASMLSIIIRFYGMPAILKGLKRLWHNSLPLRLREEVVFHRDGRGSGFLVQGWSHPESWGVWSDGPVARLRFRLSPRPAGKVVLRIQLQAFVPVQSSAREVDVSIANRPIDRWRFDSGNHSGERRLVADQEMINSDGTLEIGFHILKPESPSQFGLSNDARKLGIGLVSLIVEANTPSAPQTSQSI